VVEKYWFSKGDGPGGVLAPTGKLYELLFHRGNWYRNAS